MDLSGSGVNGSSLTNSTENPEGSSNSTGSIGNNSTVFGNLTLDATLDPQIAERSLLPPGSPTLAFTVYVKGDDIYTCANGTFAGTVGVPESLFFANKDDANSGVNPLGTHGSINGHSSFTFNRDGSEFLGSVVKKVTVDPVNLPWLLLDTFSASSFGEFSGVTNAVRSQTFGGVAPNATCINGDTSRVPYESLVSFFAGGQVC